MFLFNIISKANALAYIDNFLKYIGYDPTNMSQIDKRIALEEYKLNLELRVDSLDYNISLLNEQDSNSLSLLETTNLLIEEIDFYLRFLPKEKFSSKIKRLFK